MKFNNLKIVVFTVLTAPVLMANFGGSPGGRTGSPGDGGGTCATNGGCHGPKTPIAQEMITTDVPDAGYAPGDTLNITINATLSGVNKYGFEMIAEGANDDPKGVFVGNSTVTAISGGIRATHKAQSAQGSNDAHSWNVQWVAPTAGTGDLKFYIAVLAANNNGGNGGDRLLIDTLELTENLAAGMSSIQHLDVEVYPNPSSNFISIRDVASSQVEGTIFSLSGSVALQFSSTENIDISDLASGTYILKLKDGQTHYSSKFIKN